MRRGGPIGPDPDEGEGLFERLRGAVSRLLGGLGGDRPEQALPLDRYQGQSRPVVPYHERRQQLARSPRRQHSAYAFIFIIVLLVLVVGIFYGLAWALGSLSQGGSSRATPTSTRASGPAAAPSPTETVSALPTPPPGGIAASPSPLPGPGGAAAGTPSPEPRTYTVKAGDTPGGIAREFGVSVEALMRANNISDARALRVGDRLVIPPPPTPTPTR